jgi:RNA recognition motif-containing protein
MTHIFIHNLDSNATEEELRTVFSAHGQVNNVNIVKDRDRGETRGLAFVEMPDESSAQAAIRSLDGSVLNGQTLRVNEARDKPDIGTDMGSPQLRDHRRHRI